MFSPFFHFLTCLFPFKCLGEKQVLSVYLLFCPITSIEISLHLPFLFSGIDICCSDCLFCLYFVFYFHQSNAQSNQNRKSLGQVQVVSTRQFSKSFFIQQKYNTPRINKYLADDATLLPCELMKSLGCSQEVRPHGYRVLLLITTLKNEL